MRLLLDTHIWLWSLLEPERLAEPVVRLFEDPETEIWLSPISLWELSLLSKRKKIVLNLPVDEWVAEALARAPMREAHVTYEIAMETGSIELPHRDPADRFLAATAKVFDLTLVTADERLLALQDISLLSNR